MKNCQFCNTELIPTNIAYYFKCLNCRAYYSHGNYFGKILIDESNFIKTLSALYDVFDKRGMIVFKICEANKYNNGWYWEQVNQFDLSLPSNATNKEKDDVLNKLLENLEFI